MEKFWNELQFNPFAPVEVPYKAELFHSPPKRIVLLRFRARMGRRRLERSIRKQEGRPKLVLGNPNDAQQVASLLDLVHGPGLVQSGSRSNSTEHKRRRRNGRPVGSSSMRSSKASENQERTTRKAKNPQRAAPVWGCSLPSRSTKQTKDTHAVLEDQR